MENKLTVEEEEIRLSYVAFRDAYSGYTADKAFARLSKTFCDGFWKDYIPILETFRKPFSGGVFLDFGCKFGHLTPLLSHLGVSKIFALDANRDYLNIGGNTFGQLYDVDYVRSSDCRIPLEPNSVDFILVNEVISHINPRFLGNFYDEVARVLRRGGEIVVSDGNNLAHQKTHLDLLQMYEAWENGPESKEFGQTCYREMRERIVRQTAPELDADAIVFVAKNTSGMFGDELRAEVRAFVETGELIRRPYRAGMCPTNPHNGTVMERGFYPDLVERAFEGVGLVARQVFNRGRESTEVMNPNLRGTSKTFRIRAEKVTDDLLTMIADRKMTLEARHAAHEQVPAGVADDPALERRDKKLKASVENLEIRWRQLHESIASLKERHAALTTSIRSLEDRKARLSENKAMSSG